ncbi:chaperone protein DnaJ-like [Schistocerca gregaria]|uniref:chaperone protein DnaJ-like n=1 Tax=Schistocerca gregaria TaxID=7010 RepID=UPI00211E06B0|nr:chaperone protein DnaJ-like [Schistocerca gregaria]
MSTENGRGFVGKTSYYEVLGVGGDATRHQIKEAYYRLAKECHPDAGNRSDHERFVELYKAYSILSDPKKRERYDLYGEDAEEIEMVDATDMFEELNKEGLKSFFTDELEDLQFGHGANVEVSVSVKFMDAMTGKWKMVAYDCQVPCQACEGTGSSSKRSSMCYECDGRGVKITSVGGVKMSTSCSDCEGTGRVVSDPCPKCSLGTKLNSKIIEVSVPAGVEDGMYLRVQGEGHCGKRGLPPGDLFLKVSVEPHPVFRRSGSEVHSDVSISFVQACLGDSVAVETVYGRRTVQVPPGTQPGCTLRLERLGAPVLGQPDRFGPHIVHVAVRVPTSLTPSQIEALQALDSSSSPPSAG